MLHTFTETVHAESILFEDQLETRLQPEGAGFRPRGDGDVELLKAFELDDTAGWVVTLNGRIAGAGGILYNHRSTKDKPVPNSDRFALALSQIAEKGLQSRELTGNVEGSF
jgi:hypothetical protein